MRCDQRRDSIFLYAADQLEPAEKEALRAHLSGGCPVCAGTLAEAEATLAQMTLALEPVEPRDQTRDALMTRIADTGSGTNRSATDRLATPLAVGVQRRFHAGGAETLSASGHPPQAASLNGGMDARRIRMRIFSTALLSAAASVAITCAIFLYVTRTQREFFRSTNLQTVALTSDTQPKARGQVLWDRQHSQWRVSVFDLAPPPPGKEYELWFIAPKGPVRSKTFTVDENGHQSLVVQVPTDIGPVAAAAITLEKQGGTDVPTMPIQLIGKVAG